MKLILILFPGWILIISPLFGQNRDTTGFNNFQLDSVVVSADRLLTKINDAATHIEILNNERIEKTNGSTLSDLLKTSVNVNVKSYGTSPYLNSISMNGSSAEQTLVMLDGVVINSAQNSMLDLSQIPAHFLSSVEIINSGLSSLYGSNSIGGMINLSSEKNYIPDGNKNYELGITAGFGSYNKRTLGFDLSGKISNKITGNIFFSNEKSEDDFEFYYDNGISKEKRRKENTGYNCRDAGITLSADIDSSFKIKLTSFYIDHDKNLPGIETGNAPVKSGQRDRNLTNILSLRKFLNSSLAVKATLNYQNNLMNYKTLPLTDSQHKNRVLGVHLQTEKVFESFTFLTAYDFSKAVLNSSDTEGTPQRNNNAYTFAVSSNFLNRVIFSGSIRHDSFSDIRQKVTTANAGFNYSPVKGFGLKLRGNAGNNFRAPSFNDMYWEISGNKDLKPERSINAETGFLLTLPEIMSSRIDFSFTYIEAKDKIMWLPQRGTTLWSPINIEESLARVYSIVYGVSKKVSGNFSIAADAGLSFNSTVKTGERYPSDPTTGKQIFYIPLNTSKINLMLGYSNIGLNIFYRYTGPRFKDMENKFPLNPFHTVDINLTYENTVWDLKYRGKFEINNLFNCDYQVVSGYPMPLRNYQLTIQLNY